MASEKKKEGLKDEITFPKGASASYESRILTIKGAKGEGKRNIKDPRLVIGVKDSGVEITILGTTKKEKKLLNTMVAHIRNMMKGVTEGHLYKLKVCSGHFPMNITIKGNDFSIKNFLGEKIPRAIKIKEGAEVKLNGDMIEVTSCSKETAGQTAADIEQLTRITNRDRRIFQDGIYIIEKDGKKI